MARCRERSGSQSGFLIAENKRKHSPQSRKGRKGEGRFPFLLRGQKGKDLTPRSSFVVRTMADINELSSKIIGAAIEVHKALGPGLLESTYEECLCHELKLRGLAFERQKPLPVVYKEKKLDCGYRLDMVVENAIIL